MIGGSARLSLIPWMAWGYTFHITDIRYDMITITAFYYEQIMAIHSFSLEEIKKSRLGKFIEFKAENECWPFLGTKGTGGYGKISWKGKVTYAHRLIYQLLNGEIPEKGVIMHLCNFAPCCNPKHLKLGTYQENALHMWQGT